MYRLPILLLILTFFPGTVHLQQTGDTAIKGNTDSLQTVKAQPLPDSLHPLLVTDTARQQLTGDTESLKSFKDKKTGVFFIKTDGKESHFYLLIFLILLMAFIHRLFPKYFQNLFRLFFRTTLNQSQIREQMIQAPLPSLLLNIFFVITGGLYLAFLFRHFNSEPVDNFWLLFLYCSLGLSVIYIVKYLWLIITGWIFTISEAAGAYIFIIFVINKVLGIFLLPVLVLLAFTQGNIYHAALMISYTGIGAFLVYRFILTFSAIRNRVHISIFHFLLYILAFEISPLLIIYKLLLVILSQTA